MENYLTREEFGKFEQTVRDEFEKVNRKLDYIVDPKRGVYADMLCLSSRVDSAHERLNLLSGEVERQRTILNGNGGRNGLRNKVRNLDNVHRGFSGFMKKLLIPLLVLLFSALGSFLFFYLSNMDKIAKIIDAYNAGGTP